MEPSQDLTTNTNMMQLSKQPNSTNNKVTVSRKHFNDAVTSYITYQQTFAAVFFTASFCHC
tara:strand:- start:231 stop:413 length:183 start_codon:yes stop_codon:yes gene_type:complete